MVLVSVPTSRKPAIHSFSFVKDNEDGYFAVTAIYHISREEDIMQSLLRSRLGDTKRPEITRAIFLNINLSVVTNCFEQVSFVMLYWNQMSVCS